MDFNAIVAFWGTSILFVITPGADWAYAIAAGLRNRAFPAVSGLLLGHIVATIVVAAGIGTLVSRVPAVLTVVTIAGAAYLVWLGVLTFARPATPHVGTGDPRVSRARWIVKGFGVSGLNPKVFLLFVALLPQFIDAESPWPLAAQIGVLGLAHVLSCAVVYTAVALSARAVLRSRPGVARIVSRVSGAAMIAIGLILIVEQVL